MVRPAGSFLDALRIFVRGGRGGQGLPKFGGHGGRGGDVYCVGEENITLKKIIDSDPSKGKKRFIAQNGQPSRSTRILGEFGQDLVVPVPPGVVLWNSDQKKLIASIDKVGEKVLIAKGGAGGNPRNGFEGLPGAGMNVYMEMKLIADIGLVGFPNAGKSTLLRTISRARPKVAAYPFTTIHPTIGNVEFEDQRTFTVADLPGLIEGAHANLGMGHRFLRHVERTHVLLFIVDINGFQLGPRYSARTAIETVILLNKELELYRPELVTKPALLAVNKMDTFGSAKKLDELKAQIKAIHTSEAATSILPVSFLPSQFVHFEEILPISALKDPYSLHLLKARLRQMLDETVVEDAVVEEEVRRRIQESAVTFAELPERSGGEDAEDGMKKLSRDRLRWRTKKVAMP